MELENSFWPVADSRRFCRFSRWCLRISRKRPRSSLWLFQPRSFRPLQRCPTERRYLVVYFPRQTLHPHDRFPTEVVPSQLFSRHLPFWEIENLGRKKRMNRTKILYVRPHHSVCLCIYNLVFVSAYSLITGAKPKYTVPSLRPHKART